MGAKLHVPNYRPVLVGTLAAGSEFTIANQGKWWWRMLYLSFTLATSGVAGNRAVTVVLDDRTDVYSAMAAGATQAINETRRWGAYPGASAGGLSTVSGTLGWPSDGLWIPPGWRIRTVTGALDAGDQYAAVRALVEELPTGPMVEWVPTTETRQDERV